MTITRHCLTCDAEIETATDAKTCECACGARFSIDYDADYRDGHFIDASALVPIELFKVYTRQFQGDLRYCVPSIDHPTELGFGDSVWRTEAEAIAYADIERRRLKERQECLEAAKRQALLDAEAEKQRLDLDGYEATLSSMQHGRAAKVLCTEICANGKVITRKQLIRDTVAAGWILETVGGKLCLYRRDGGAYRTFDRLGGNIAKEYATYLIANRKVKL